MLPGYSMNSSRNLIHVYNEPDGPLKCLCKGYFSLEIDFQDILLLQ